MDFVKTRHWFFLGSFILIAVGVVSMLVPPAFRLGIEFTGGSALSITFASPVKQEDVRAQMAALGHQEAVIQGTGANSFLIRTKTLEEAQRDAQGNVVKPAERGTIEKTLATNLAPIKTLELTSVSPLVAGETVRNAAIAVAVATGIILLYISFAFRRVPNALRMGTTAVMALIHNVLITLGLFSILGKFFNVEVDAMFITGALTVVGYSVHDTIVVFDRIRENTLRGAARTLEDNVNISMWQTLVRSLTTGITAIIVIITLLMLGGPTIRGLLLTMLIGIVTGTYGSIFIASQLLVVWERGEWLGPLRRKRPAGAPASSD